MTFTLSCRSAQTEVVIGYTYNALGNRLTRESMGQWGVSKSWVNEIFDVRLVIGESLFVGLSAVESKYKQLQGTLQSIRATRETARSACEPC